jgi:hypothetical protein
MASLYCGNWLHVQAKEGLQMTTLETFNKGLMLDGKRPFFVQLATPEEALNRHIKACHNGSIDEKCAGCKELQMKITQAV